MNIPKTALCKECNKKPKEVIWAMGYSDKDDELYLVHWCTPKNEKVHFPELKKNPFTANYVNGQRPLVIEAWNKLQTEKEQIKETP